MDQSKKTDQIIKATAECRDFSRKANRLVEKLSSLIIRLPQKGNTDEECQRLTLATALNEVSRAVNGTGWEDFIPNDDKA